jgi:hypothetical protein
MMFICASLLDGRVADLVRVACSRFGGGCSGLRGGKGGPEVTVIVGLAGSSCGGLVNGLFADTDRARSVLVDTDKGVV